MNTESPSSLPWKPEKELWPLPDSIPAELALRFPGKEAVEMLVKNLGANFASLELAWESAVGFVNYRRRSMAAQQDLGLEV